LISAVVLAAGLSRRMGRPKLVLPLGGKPVLERVLDVLRRAKVDETVVVLGANAAQVRKIVRFEKEKVVVNPGYRKGMSSSIRVGLRSIDRDADAVLIVLGDQPFLSARTVDAVVDGFVEKRAPVVVPVLRGVRGNPVLFARSVFPKAVKIRGDVGAKSVVKAYGESVLEVPVQDEGVLFDIDTPSEYRRATSNSGSAGRRKTQGEA